MTKITSDDLKKSGTGTTSGILLRVSVKSQLVSENGPNDTFPSAAVNSDTNTKSTV